MYRTMHNIVEISRHYTNYRVANKNQDHKPKHSQARKKKTKQEQQKQTKEKEQNKKRTNHKSIW